MTLPVFCARALSACGVALGLVGCNIDQILKVDDPDIVIQANSPAPASNIGLMFALIGYSENLAGELFCNGTPLSYLSGSTAVYGDPLTNDSVFALAIAAADSALANRAGVDSARVRQLASVVKGRALLNRGQFATAALAVALVADTFHFDVTHSLVTLDNLVWSLNNDARRYTMADREGGNGLPFFSANDPRIPRKLGTVNPDDLTFDSGIFVTRQGIWDRLTPLKIATGIEARLIEAEAALHASPPDNATWFAKLSALRANTALLPTPQPGTRPGPTSRSPIPATTPHGWTPRSASARSGCSRPATGSATCAAWCASTAARPRASTRLATPGTRWGPTATRPCCRSRSTSRTTRSTRSASTGTPSAACPAWCG